MEEETIVIKIPKLDLEKKLKEELKKGIETFARIEIARLLLLKKWNKILRKSKLTEKDCIELARLAKRETYEELKKLGLVD